MKKIFLSCLFLTLTACSSITQPSMVKLSTVINSVKNDLQDTDSVQVNNFSEWTTDQKVKFDEVVAEQQCQAKTADPLISVLNDSFALNLNGSFTKSGSFGITTTPSGNVSGTLSKTSGQSVSVPVNFVPLSELPDFELNKKLTLESELFSGNKSDEDLAKIEETDLLSERKGFRNHIQVLINSYSSTFCLTNNFNNHSSFVTVKPKQLN